MSTCLCLLNQYGRCCCTCVHRKTDYEHCTTNPELRHKAGGCCCSVFKGYVCANPEMEGVHSGWGRHGMCELHTRKVIQSPHGYGIPAIEGYWREAVNQ